MDTWDPVTLTWRFQRNDDELQVRRSADPHAIRLIIQGPSGIRTLDFQTHKELIVAQTQLEDHLTADGWQLIAFSPERRVTVTLTARADVERRHPVVRSSD